MAQRQYGFILAEILVGVSLLILMVGVAIHSVVGIQWGPSTLDIETERLVWYIRKVEYISITGYPNEFGKPAGMEVEKSCIRFNNYGKKLESWVISLQEPILCMNADRYINFDINGRPYGAMTIVLLDPVSGNSNEVIIAAQTGRVRWRPLIRHGQLQVE